MQTITDHDRANARMLRALADARREVYGEGIDSDAAVLRTAADILAPDPVTCPHPGGQRLTTSEAHFGGYSVEAYETCGRCWSTFRDGRWTLP